MDPDNKTKITPAPDGPYLVKYLKKLINQKGPIENRETMALCRCGRSDNKPFCDGAHSKIGFSSSKQEDRLENKQDHYTGEKITIHDNRSVCAHAGRCTDGLSAVFRMKEEPWIHPNAETKDKIIDTINKCPSGALSYSIEAIEPVSHETEPTIFIAPNGPYVVTGGPELSDTTLGEGASGEHYTLCRCGGSKNKPFCDGSHWYNDFTDDKN